MASRSLAGPLLPPPPLGSGGLESTSQPGEVVLGQRSSLHHTWLKVPLFCKKLTEAVGIDGFSIWVYTFLFPKTKGSISSLAIKLIMRWPAQCRIPFESRQRKDPINSMSGGRSLGVRVGCAMHTADLRP